MKGETILSEVFLVASTISPDTETIETIETQKPWIVIVWNDPINLMSYVSFVFQKLFGYSKEKANNEGPNSTSSEHPKSVPSKASLAKEFLIT